MYGVARPPAKASHQACYRTCPWGKQSKAQRPSRDRYQGPAGTNFKTATFCGILTRVAPESHHTSRHTSQKATATACTSGSPQTAGKPNHDQCESFSKFAVEKRCCRILCNRPWSCQVCRSTPSKPLQGCPLLSRLPGCQATCKLKHCNWVQPQHSCHGAHTQQLCTCRK